MNEPNMDDKIQQLVTAVLEAVDARLDGIRDELVQFSAGADARHRDILGTVAELQRRVDELAAQPAPPSSPAANHQSTADLNERMAQATKILVERIEAAHRDATLATDRKVAELAAQIEMLRGGADDRPAASARPLAEALSTVDDKMLPSTVPTQATVPTAATPTAATPTAPVAPSHVPSAAMSGSFGHVTGQLPHLTDSALDEISRPLYEHGHVTAPTPMDAATARLRQVTAPPMPPLVTPSMAPAGASTPTAHTAHADIDIARLTSLINEKLEHLSLPNRPD